jgi:hypothetical protein
VPVLGKYARDLVDVNLFFAYIPSQSVDLNCNGERLLRHDNCIEVRIQRRTEPVIQGFNDPIRGKVLA